MEGTKTGCGLRYQHRAGTACGSSPQVKASLYPSVPGGRNAVLPSADGLFASAGRLESVVCTENAG